MIKNNPCVYGDARNTETEKDAFDFFLIKEIMESSVSYANKRIKARLDQIPPEDIASRKYPHSKDIDLVDLYALYGLLYFRGLYHLNSNDIRLSFSDPRGLPIFGATMSRLRYQFILAHLSFDDI